MLSDTIIHNSSAFDLQIMSGKCIHFGYQIAWQPIQYCQDISQSQKCQLHGGATGKAKGSLENYGCLYKML